MKTLPDPNLNWSIPLAAVELIADAEGLCLNAYRCPAGIPTIGWGQTVGVQLGMTWTKKQADDDLCISIEARCKRILELCSIYPTGYELGAMVSLHYNIGHDAFARSTVLRCHNANDRQSASRAFGLWNKATVNGQLQELRGLTARRAAESALYLRPEDGAPALRMPQAVAPETTIARSPIAQTGAVAVATGGVSVLSEFASHLGSVGGVATQARTVIVDTLGIPASAFLPIILVFGGGIVVWQRYKQRIKGWA